MSAVDVPGRTLDSSGPEPSIMELAVWRKAAEIYRSGLEYSRLGGQLHNVSVNVTELIGNVRLFQAGGATVLTAQASNDKVTAQEAKDRALASLNTELSAKLNELNRIKQAVTAINPAEHGVRRMERDIWHLWMASLQLNSNILDIDAIEDHIGPKGLRIVGFGAYTSDADENEAIQDARDTVMMLRAEHQQMLNPGTEANVPADPSRRLRILTQ